MSTGRKSFPELEDWDPPFQKEIVDHLSRFVRAVTADRPGSVRPEPWASTVPAVFGGRPMLLTASHVLRKLDDRQMFVEVPGRFQAVETDNSVVAQHPVVDAAVILLPDTSFEWGLDFLDLERQTSPEVHEGEVEIFLAMGFPIRETSHEGEARTLNVTLVNYRAFEHPGAYAALNLARSEYVITRFDRQQTYQKGLVRAMKLPHGMSGGGLWRFWSPDDEAPSPARGAFAGILSEYRESPVKCMISIGVDVLQDLASRVV